MKAKILCLVAFIAIFVSCNNKNEKIDTTEIIADSLMTEQQPDSVIEMGRIGIKMQKISGVYSLPALVNGVKMNFIFDTVLTYIRHIIQTTTEHTKKTEEFQ